MLKRICKALYGIVKSAVRSIATEVSAARSRLKNLTIKKAAGYLATTAATAVVSSVGSALLMKLNSPKLTNFVSLPFGHLMYISPEGTVKVDVRSFAQVVGQDLAKRLLGQGATPSVFMNLNNLSFT